MGRRTPGDFTGIGSISEPKVFPIGAALAERPFQNQHLQVGVYITIGHEKDISLPTLNHCGVKSKRARVIIPANLPPLPKLSRMKSAGVGAARLWRLEVNSYLDAPKALLKVLKHFMSTNCSLINSTSKLCGVDERVAKRTFPTLRLEPVDGLIDLLTTFRARQFER